MAQAQLGECYELGNGVKKDLTQARKWYEKAGKQGNEFACHSLGLMYLNGKGIKHSWDYAFRWLTSADAKEEIGYCYYFGYGVKKDIIMGLKWYLKFLGKDDDYSNKMSFIEKLSFSIKFQIKRLNMYLLINKNRFCFN